MAFLLAETTAVWEARRKRARELSERYDFATEPLDLYAALLEGQGSTYERALRDRPAAAGLAEYVVMNGFAAVMDATMAKGTETLREAVLLRFHEGHLEGIVDAWLSGEAQSGTDTFMARAAVSPIFEAFPELAGEFRREDATERACPMCGGAPQLAVFGETDEALVTPQRKLHCSRCATSWTFPRMTCAFCGETETSKLMVFADVEPFPHVRIDACDTCRRYLLTIDVRKDPRAVPVVDELAAIPLDLAAAERGYAKIAANLMGF
jgi:FdhE protein